MEPIRGICSAQILASTTNFGSFITAYFFAFALCWDKQTQLCETHKKSCVESHHMAKKTNNQNNSKTRFPPTSQVKIHTGCVLLLALLLLYLDMCDSWVAADCLKPISSRSRTIEACSRPRSNSTSFSEGD